MHSLDNNNMLLSKQNLFDMTKIMLKMCTLIINKVMKL